jgi:RNA polymerase sigma-70 factor (ECF subfamily)
MPNQSAYPMTRFNRTSQQEIEDTEFRIEVLVKDYFVYIHRLSYSILDDLAEAEDAAQETFISAHRALSGFRAEADPKTWLTAIAINACRARLRKRKTRQILTTTLQSLHLHRSPLTTPEDRMILREIDQSIWQAVGRLDEKHKIPVILHYVHELKVPDIARILNLNQGTVHSRLHYARQKLYSQLGHLNPSWEKPDESSE